MKAIALFSGGKDSTYAIYLAMQQGFEIEKLVTIYPKREDSYMYHVPAIDRTRYQAEAMGIPQDIHSIGDSVEDLMDVLSHYDVDAVISGAIASNFQKTKIEEVCTELGMLSYAPLWGKDQNLLLRDMLLADFKIMIVAVAAYGLDERFLGRILDDSMLRLLQEMERRYRINVSGEGGEYETFVLDAPFFKMSLQVEDFDVIWDGVRGNIKIRGITLNQKIF
ncbi:universal archaeal metal-binding-domain/4Fe-4S-binding-domain containing ABC transporter, ATP-binding protein [Aciduliprofundum sp. MAR08-339]|uniref:diphthine--ammonia ligase n=1 Tax=Aciduliprofundum sp. (strain MAR08-339) TaxID=673860 RepID=UPI0002A4A1A3|nr:universal archaeal metal-binding-domain/4Fe-4S-binding-domain containing ABC transporter, ATP-binding protein [Aciduliprofundum sp. MAR08-339]